MALFFQYVTDGIEKVTKTRYEQSKAYANGHGEP